MIAGGRTALVEPIEGAEKGYENLMIDMQPTNAKLRDRACRIVAKVAGISHEDVLTSLLQANQEVKTAVLMLLVDIDETTARPRLDAT